LLLAQAALQSIHFENLVYLLCRGGRGEGNIQLLPEFGECGMRYLPRCRKAVWAAALVGVLCVTAQTSAQERLRVGDVFAARIVTPQGYPPGRGDATERVWRHELSHPNATYIAIHFKNFHLGEGDYLKVSDPDGGQTYTMEGTGKMEAGTFWGQHIKGDTAVLELYTTRRGGGPGFMIHEYAAGFVPLATERICGPSDFENAVCRAPSVEYDRAQAVARLLIQGVWLCTGWLASANDHFITNEHCITSSAEALNTDYEFGAEAPDCNDFNCQLCWPGAIFSGASFIQDDPGLDYSLIQLDGNPSGTFGFLQIDDRQAIVGEQIYLVSHPAGRAKEFAYNSSEDAGGLATVQSVTEPTCSGATLEVGYWADTQGGSSGSPVLAVSSQRVIALHHCHNYCDQGGAPNRGVPIDQICAEICSLLRCTADPECDNLNECTTDVCVGGTCQNTPVADDTPCAGGLCCVGTCTVVVCSSHDDCDDSEQCTNDTCANPDTCSASCVNTWPVCVGGDGCCPPGCDSNNDSDCPSGFCGDGVCDGLPVEDCFSCSTDCRCAGGPTCKRGCCGDGSCEENENADKCPVDCGGGGTCGDGTCDASEDKCNCAADCGAPVANEQPTVTCTDGQDNDCDGGADCNDPNGDCDTDPACECASSGTSCGQNSECCSNKCRNGTCRGK
jgi:hypothetical protein